MTRFSAEQCRALAGMIRIHSRQMRENLAFRIILATAAHENSCVQDWERKLQELMGTPMFAALSKDVDSWVDRLERTADEVDVTELLQKFGNDPQTN